MKQHEKIFEYLKPIVEAVEPFSNASVACAVVYKRRVVSIGINKNKSHPFQAKFSSHPSRIFLHAEIDAIKNSLKQIDQKELSKASLYVYRMKRDGSFGLSMPCKGCMMAITAFNIKNVFYTVNSKNLDFKKL